MNNRRRVNFRSGNQVFGLLSFSQVGPNINLSANAFIGWKYANGKIYGIPYNSNQVGVFDPITYTFNLVGSSFSGTDKYFGGCLAANGFLYFAPFSAQRVVKFNPVDNTWAFIGSTYTGNFKWAPPVLAPNGCLYCAPWGGAGQVLKIDPSTDTTSLVGTNYAHTGISGKWESGTLALNGSIYFVPRNRGRFLKLNPLTDTTSEVGTDYGVNGVFRGCCLQDDGKITTSLTNFLISGSNRNVIILDPSTDTTSLVFFTSTSVSNWNDSVISLPSSEVFHASPANFWYRRNIVTNVFQESTELNFSNQFYGVGTVAASRSELFLFHQANGFKVVRVTKFGNYPSDIVSFPSLGTLSASNWNKYQNRF